MWVSHLLFKLAQEEFLSVRPSKGIRTSGAGMYACCCMNKHTVIQSANHSAIRLTI